MSGSHEMMRRAAWRVAPGRMGDRARRYEASLRQRTGLTDLAQRFAARHGDRVLYGPFAGMRLVAEDVDHIDAPVAKLLGCYEAELHPFLTQAIAAGPAQIIDIGTADGYYAVGLARATGRTVTGYDLSSEARALCSRTASLNGVSDRVEMRGLADRSAFGEIADGALVVCDIDGGGSSLLLDDAASPAALRRAQVVVELHEQAVPNVVERFVERFAHTHEVAIVRAAQRDLSAWPALQEWTEEEQHLGADELRFRTDGVTWALCSPRA